MSTKNFEEAVKRLSNRKLNDKYSLYYILRGLNHSKYFYTFIENFKRDELLNKVIEEIKTSKGWEKLTQMGGFKDLI